MSVTNLNIANLDIGALAIDQSKNTSNPKIEKILTTEEYIRKYFSDEPILTEIAKCESRFRQEDGYGKVLLGVVNKSDKGVMQINEYYHGDRAESLGFDLHTLEGNTQYARFLFDREGLRPWLSSSKCWKKSEAYTNYQNSVELVMK